MDYTEIRQLDEDTSKNLQESKGPADECICNIFTSKPGSEYSGKGVRASLKKVFGAIGKSKGKLPLMGGGTGGGGGGARSVTIPLGAVAPGFIHTARRSLKWKKGDCGKCGCDNNPIFLKDSDFTIKITTPDIDLDTICPCKQNCMPDKAKLKDNIKVTIEHADAAALLPIDFLDNTTKTLKSCIELTTPEKTLDNDNLQSGSKNAVELAKCFEEPSMEKKRDTLVLQKLPSVSIASDSIDSNVDETSDVVILVDDDNYEKLFMEDIFLKNLMSNVSRSKSYPG